MLECLVPTGRLSDAKAACAIDEQKSLGESLSPRLEGARRRAAAYSRRLGFRAHFLNARRRQPATHLDEGSYDHLAKIHHSSRILND